MNILAIGGSDPSAGAGVQSDIRAASALGAHCFGVITAITSQNSTRFFDVVPVLPRMVRAQINSILSDFAVDAISIGMVYDSKTIRQISSALSKITAPIVVDPVIRSTTGGILLRESALTYYRKHLVPLASAITPNVSEAEVLSGISITDMRSVREAAEEITHLGAKSILITGCEFESNTITDYVCYDKTERLLSGPKVDWQTHGSGCNFSIALAYWLGQKKNIFDAARLAKSFAFEAIRSAQSLGRGVRMTLPKKDRMFSKLASAISKFQAIRGAADFIPEVQTNFVYAKPNSKSIHDVIGVAGRIVKTKNSTVVAGGLEYGGSRHVASAVIAMQEKFPCVRAALNIRYDTDIIEKFRNAGHAVSSYDRKREPPSSRRVENSSISWGIRSAIRNSDEAPDIIYHRGDVGKEPMIILFGTSPADVLAKLKVLDSK